MNAGLQGLNKRSVDTLPEETYLTPRWAWQWLAERWKPLGDVICDPCCSGYGEWTAGGMIAAINGKASELSDIAPQSTTCQQSKQTIIKSGYKDLVLPVARRTIITNPPFDLLPYFLPWSLENADEVVLLMRFGWLCAANGKRAMGLSAYYQPAKRLAFEVLPEHVAAINSKKENSVRRCKNSATGWAFPSTGIDHGFAVWHKGHVGPALLYIEPTKEMKPTQESMF